MDYKKITTCKSGFILVLLCFVSFFSFAENNEVKTVIKPLKGESWWHGIVRHGKMMPLAAGYKADMRLMNYSNQCQPLLLSDKGRFVWFDAAYGIEVNTKGNIEISTSRTGIIEKGGKTLRDAYLAAMHKYFPPAGKMPDSVLFTAPQLNSWIEMGTNQNEKAILRYASSAREHFPPGVLMIDGGWEEGQGIWKFDKRKIPNPRLMVDSLHKMGYKVMLWISPHIKPDSPESEECLRNGHLLMTSERKPFLLKWWGGKDYVYDFSNPAAVKCLEDKLQYLINTYKIDGFKFDAGDHDFYIGDTKPYHAGATPHDHSQLYAQIGLNYPLNEYRACWKMGNQPLAQRLQDKKFEWTELSSLIADIALQGIMGYAFSCPDMVGGGDHSSFKKNGVDEELMVRSTQISTLMPMIQFSVAPWRVLSLENFTIVKQCVALRQKMLPYIMEYVKNAAVTGEPVVRLMEYQFPNQGFSGCVDQFMLGDSYLIAPMIEKGFTRKVKLPKGKWIDDKGNIFKGDKTIKINVPLDRLPIFFKL